MIKIINMNEGQSRLDQGLEYRKVVEKYQRYLQERSNQRKLQHSSNDKLTSAVKNIYLNPLLPQLSQTKQPKSSQRLQKRSTSVLKDPYLMFKMSSEDQVSNNLQNSIVSPTTRKEESAPSRKSFFIGLYKNQRQDSPPKNVTIKDLVNAGSKKSLLPASEDRKQVALPHISKEIQLSRYFVKRSRSQVKKSVAEMSFTNKWERERGTTFISLEHHPPEQLVDGMLAYIKTQEPMRLAFEDVSQLLLKARLVELVRGIFFEETLNFEKLFQFFGPMNLTYLEVFYLKYSLAMSLLIQQQSFSQVEKALNQFEEHRYLLIRPPHFVVKLFDSTFYNQLIRSFSLKLLKSPSYIKFMSQHKLENEQLVQSVKNSLFPYLVGDYLALPLHAHNRDIKAEIFRQQQLVPYINPVFIIQLKQQLQESNVEDCYIKDVEHRLLFPNKEAGQNPFCDDFATFYVNCWVQNKTTLVPTHDIKALLTVLQLGSSDDLNKSQIEENFEYFNKYPHIKPNLTMFL